MDLLLSARGLPPKTPALFIYALTQQSVPFGQGTKCVGPSQTFRVKSALTSTIAGSIDTVLNYANLPAAGKIQVGDTWNFQAWFRDGSGAFDLTDAVQITFIP